MSDITIDEADVILTEGTESTVAEAESEPLVDASGQHILMFEDYVAVMLGDDKSTIEKRISYEDFHSIISSVLDQRSQERLEGFQLPTNCLYFAHSANVVQITCYYPECIETIGYQSKKYEIKLPNIIISHTLTKRGNGWQITGSRYFSTDVKPGALPNRFIFEFSPSEGIYISPLPNTYSEGNMCYGQNSMPTTFPSNNLKGLNWYYKFLFDSPFNDDLGCRGVASVPSVAAWLETLAQAAKTNSPFPYDKLRGFIAR